MATSNAFLIGSTNRGGSTRRLAHANVLFTVGISAAITVAFTLNPYDRCNVNVGFATRIQFATDKRAASVTFRTGTPRTMVDDFTDGIGATCSTQRTRIFTLATNARFVDGTFRVRTALCFSRC